MRSVVTVRSWLEQVMPKAQAEPKQGSHGYWLGLSDSELSDIIDCVANAADRAESTDEVERQGAGPDMWHVSYCVARTEFGSSRCGSWRFRTLGLHRRRC